ncbi:hypothetical protein ACFQX6_65875 [Streptosporangium lutulentum]
MAGTVAVMARVAHGTRKRLTARMEAERARRSALLTAARAEIGPHLAALERAERRAALTRRLAELREHGELADTVDVLLTHAVRGRWRRALGMWTGHRFRPARPGPDAGPAHVTAAGRRRSWPASPQSWRRRCTRPAGTPAKRRSRSCAPGATRARPRCSTSTPLPSTSAWPIR